MAFEQTLDLAAGQLRGGGDLIERQRLLDVVLHQLRYLDERFVASTHLRAQRHVLPVAVVADAIENELFGDELRHLRPESRLDRLGIPSAPVEAEQEIIGISHVAQAPVGGVGGIARWQGPEGPP